MIVRSDCPIANALDLWGDKWSLLIMRDILLKGKCHYGQFLQSGERVSTNILADRLQRLEQAGTITKRQDSDKKTRFVYAPTTKGLDMLPLIVEISLWSLLYNPQTFLEPDIVTAMQTDKVGFIRYVRGLHA